ncbi:hypothetical protein [Phenylobacterium sp.]|uniref:hypothetical protein n=1 Tax=Phenylobacterium sp. TaxID=1871053 RepID=UPI0025D3E1AC|nr:hypothetical protein [Phenylobacterium sp.]MBX3484802.1 hypothetical protein [Phenylobacterium sp.]MCW5759077.1 hypothetical protein [Phenylobacterium sp.]
MANFIVSYDLNGPSPSHHEMDEHLQKLGGTRGRLLETVWYVKTEGMTHVTLRNYVAAILQPEDQLLVVDCYAAAWQNLLVTDASFKGAWES